MKRAPSPTFCRTGRPASRTRWPSPRRAVGAALVALGLSLAAGVSAAPAASPKKVLDATWLLRAAETAEPDVAVTLFRAALQVDRAPRTLFMLARQLEATGWPTEAREEYQAFLKVAPRDDPDRSIAQAARERLTRLLERSAPTARRPPSAPARAEAAKAFGLGRAAALAGKHADATRYLHAALILDPSLSGPHRLLGAVYAKLGKSDEALNHLAEYLRIRPDGPLASQIRQTLSKRHVLGMLKTNASFPSQMWVNGYPVSGRTPMSLSLPGGEYNIALLNAQYHVGKNFKVQVIADSQAAVSFSFGILKVNLDPWARIRADGRDLGLWTELGLPPGTYHLSFESHNKKLRAEVRLNIKAGQTIAINNWQSLMEGKVGVR
ncbi:MAG: hypothetical protein IT371_09465 [Deltaproteobacteria bacterium]|nr:hypothetical protein [Deltaproteobacteria bacterium]